MTRPTSRLHANRLLGGESVEVGLGEKLGRSDADSLSNQVDEIEDGINLPRADRLELLQGDASPAGDLLEREVLLEGQTMKVRGENLVVTNGRYTEIWSANQGWNSTPRGATE
nr:hypothetical protein [Enhygromyxa salina]